MRHWAFRPPLFTGLLRYGFSRARVCSNHLHTHAQNTHICIYTHAYAHTHTHSHTCTLFTYTWYITAGSRIFLCIHPTVGVHELSLLVGWGCIQLGVCVCVWVWVWVCVWVCVCMHACCTCTSCILLCGLM